MSSRWAWRFRHPEQLWIRLIGPEPLSNDTSCLGAFMMDIKKIAAGATIAGALGLTALGMGAGVASATPPLPATPQTPWLQDKPHGDGNGGHGGGNWGKGPGHGGPGVWNQIDACIAATGPYGYVTGYVCI